MFGGWVLAFGYLVGRGTEDGPVSGWRDRIPSFLLLSCCSVFLFFSPVPLL